MPAVPGSEPKPGGVESPGVLVASGTIGLVMVLLEPGRLRLSEAAPQARRPAQLAVTRNRREILDIVELKAMVLLTAGRRVNSYAARFAAPIVVRSQTLTAHRQKLMATTGLTSQRAAAPR
jgi:hypothetical protein